MPEAALTSFTVCDGWAIRLYSPIWHGKLATSGRVYRASEWAELQPPATATEIERDSI